MRPAHTYTQVWLWANEDNLGFYYTLAGGNKCFFTAVSQNRVIKEWCHVTKCTGNICFVQADKSGTSSFFKMLWYRDGTILCDYITLGPGNVVDIETEPVITVKFPISNFHVLWSRGIVFVFERTVGNLHVFDTGHDRYLGYITLFSSDVSPSFLLKFDSETTSLWAIVRKYDELTKTSSAFLNTYSVPDFILATTVPLPRGFAQHTFAREKRPHSTADGPLRKIESTLTCSSCDILNRSIIQWYVSPKMPWKERTISHAANCIPAANQNTISIYEGSKDSDFQPSSRFFEFENLSSDI